MYYHQVEMTPYTLNLPVQLQQEAEKLASLKQHYSLEELVEPIAPENLHNEIDSGVAVGNEIW